VANQSTIAETEGFSALLAHTGEWLTFRNARLTGLVNRDPFEKKNSPKRVDLDARDVSEIQIFTTAATAITPAPKTGESFKDEFGHYHRIDTWKCIGVATTYYCTVSDA
jgi:hypothetical protein